MESAFAPRILLRSSGLQANIIPLQRPHSRPRSNPLTGIGPVFREISMRKLSRATLVAAVLALSFGSVTGMNTAMAQSAKPVTTASGLQTIDTVVGTGASPRPNQTAVVHYTGWLYANGTKGKKFDSSVDRNEPFDFPVGAGRVIKGWDEGVAGMKVGGKRTLIVPPNLGYGASGAGGVIPPNATLMFDVELISLK
jgi:peptidylprolyl isomerase